MFAEAFRVLAPGGRLAVSDVVAIGDLPAAIAADPDAYTGCIAGAASIAELERMIAGTGFKDVRIAVQVQSRDLIKEWNPGSGAEQFVASALIEAVKPGAGRSPEPCCDSVLLDTCCPPDAKSACCEHSSQVGSCGCQGSGSKR